MEPGKKSKVLFLLLAVCIAFPVVFTEALSYDSLDHDCTDTECLPCHLIEAAKHFRKTFRQAGSFLLGAVDYLFFPAKTFITDTEFISCICSPVTLKVRFNS